MNKHFLILPITLILLMSGIATAKILIVVEQSYYLAQTARISRLSTDVQLYDNKTVEIVPWQFGPIGPLTQKCKMLWNFLESKYNDCNLTSDPLEGAVLIGNIPVPQTKAGSTVEPFDYYYMDIWNSNTDNAYPNHDMTPFSIDSTDTDFFTTKYNVLNGDFKLDIWVSRIYGTLIGTNQHLRSSAPGGNPNAVLSETEIYNEYLDRIHKRYTEPALVPSRGFAMGGTGDLSDSLQTVLSMDQLDLPMYVEFNGGAYKNTGEASAFNLMSQLQAGPKGCTTFGAYNGITFPGERNARNCTYSELMDARSYAPYNNRVYNALDDYGWEWAGIFTHSGPTNFSFNYNDHFCFNGRFTSGTYGPFWGNNMRRTGGYSSPDNPSGHYYYYNVNGISTDPFGFNIYRDKRAYFQYKVRETGRYSVYIYYHDSPQNCSNGQIRLLETTLDASGLPTGGTPYNNHFCPLSMKTHIKRDGSTDWERIFYGVKLKAGSMVTLQIEANGQDGEVIADAVRFVCASPAIDDKVDNVEPLTTAGDSSIFSRQGFYTSDCIDRSFYSMQDENSTHDKFSKVPFFLTSMCGINNFLYDNYNIDPLGNLLALGHNGLICMGTSTNNDAGLGYVPFLRALASGKNFGNAFLEQANYGFKVDDFYNLVCMYSLLGAGTLRAQPYIQFNSELKENETLSNTVTENSTKPVVIRDLTVTSAGRYTVLSEVSSENQIYHSSEIVVRPETEFLEGSTVTLSLIGKPPITIAGVGVNFQHTAVYAITPDGTVLKMRNTDYRHGMMFTVRNKGTNDSLIVEWYGVRDQNQSICQHQSADLFGNGAQINNVCATRDAASGEMTVWIRSATAQTYTVDVEMSNWRNGNGCQ